MPNADDLRPPSLPLAGNYTGIDACIRELLPASQSTSVRLAGRFFYLTFRDGRQNISKLAQFLYWRTIPFCLPRDRYKHHLALFQETQDPRYIHEATDEARDLFVRASSSRNSTGEPAELLLFVLLEYFFNAPQVACKMSLKTAHNVAVFGADAVHMVFDEQCGQMVVYWGEAKLNEQLSAALDATCTSKAEFLVPRQHTTPRERDIQILRLHANIPDGEMRKAYLKFFDPYEEQDNYRRDIHSCLIAFERSLFDGLDALDAAAVDKEFCDRYRPATDQAMRLFEQKIVSTGLQAEHFALMAVPIADVAELRSEFFRYLRIDVPDGG